MPTYMYLYSNLLRCGRRPPKSAIFEGKIQGLQCKRPSSIIAEFPS